MTALRGVSISTTGQEHRLPFLETSVRRWDAALPVQAPLFVTVDGNETEAAAVVRAIGSRPYNRRVEIWQVGSKVAETFCTAGARRGVAANKNTGMELLVDAGVQHLYLSDDDTGPRTKQAVDLHVDMGEAHSMVVWGGSRLQHIRSARAEWTWPRGVMLYATAEVLGTVGGMDERFWPGGHEHVEWSRRICTAGFTDAPFISPAIYAHRNGKGAFGLWDCEDMPRNGERREDLGERRKQITTVHRTGRDWNRIREVMAERDNSKDFVPFRAEDNGRFSATLCWSL